jgi:hypothetical protein
MKQPAGQKPIIFWGPWSSRWSNCKEWGQKYMHIYESVGILIYLCTHVLIFMYSYIYIWVYLYTYVYLNILLMKVIFFYDHVYQFFYFTMM